MRRTTIEDLDHLAGMISRMLKQSYTIGYAYGRPRLYTKNESVEVSPRLPKGELMQWMEVLIQGIGLGFARNAASAESTSMRGVNVSRRD